MKGEKCPLPEDPTLAALAQALNDAGQWAEITDAEWRCQYLTDEASLMYGGLAELVSYPVGAFTFGPEATSARLGWQGGQFPLEIACRSLTTSGPWLLAEWPGGRQDLRELVDPRLHEVFDSLSPASRTDAITYRFRGVYTGAGAAVDIPVTPPGT